MKISKKNIENLIIKYFEGELTIEESRNLLEVISSNEEFKNIYESISATYIKAPNIIFKNKDNLKKIVKGNVINEWEDLCIQYIENELNENEKKLFIETIQNDADKRKVFEQYGLVKLIPNEEDIYKNKNLLKKEKSWNETFEDLCVKRIENLLSNKEIKEFDEIIKNDKEKANVYFLYQKTILHPDLSVKYTKKENLKKYKTFKRTYIQWYAAAAIIIAFVLLLPNMINNIKETPLLPHSKKSITVFTKTNFNNTKPYENKLLNTKVTISKTKDTTFNSENVDFELYTQIKKEEQKVLNEDIYKENNLKNDTVIDVEALGEVLDRIFANHKFNYFHDMMNFEEEQTKISYNNYSNLWSLLKQSSKHISNFTGVDIRVQDYDNENSIKKVIAIGNFSFSRTTIK